MLLRLITAALAYAAWLVIRLFLVLVLRRTSF